MYHFVRMASVVFLAVTFFFACERVEESNAPATGAASDPNKPLAIGVSFETLQTEFWVASHGAIKKELAGRSIAMKEAIADNDANKQMEQVNNFIAQKVDGIIVAPKDKNAAIRMAKNANEAGIPIVFFNRPPAEASEDVKFCAIVADNYAITRDTVTYMAEQAKKSGRKYKPLVLVGDMGDINAIGRLNGFRDVVKQYPDVFAPPIEVRTDWNQEMAKSGMTNALTATPDVNFVFSCTDFLFEPVIGALSAAGKYKKIGEEGHVLLGGFDGDSKAYTLLRDGYLDADGVQDMAFESRQAVQAILDMRAGKDVPRKIDDKGFVIHQGNLAEMAPRMWGAQIVMAKEGK